MTDSTTSRRIRAADDVETIHRRLQELRTEREKALSRPAEEDPKPPPGWFAAMRPDWVIDAATWQASVRRSGR